MAGTLGVIFGNRDFFPDQLIGEARKDILGLFKDMGLKAVMLGEKDTKLGSVETYEHAKACADLFKANREKIEGILVVLPNFGDEKGVADAVKLSGSQSSIPGALFRHQFIRQIFVFGYANPPVGVLSHEFDMNPFLPFEEFVRT